ncbi:hypothetical protein PI124_g8876 [Phytophthora idaei]|nr:hypothetical protein PI126_g19632 [Phytophthora idaei]KAG3246368.1 hypothetical protein PI124_g8876 [Phytophthora idaei]
MHRSLLLMLWNFFICVISEWLLPRARVCFRRRQPATRTLEKNHTPPATIGSFHVTPSAYLRSLRIPADDRSLLRLPAR